MTTSPEFVGIDISKSALDIFSAAAGRGERIDNASAPVAALAERWRGRDVFVVFEATGSYDRKLAAALQRAGIAFARVNPQRARDFARAAGFLAKTDRIDARMLAMMGERLRPKADAPASAERERLRILHRRRDQLVHMRAQERTRLGEDPDERRDIERHIAWLSAAIKDLDGRIRDRVAAVRELGLLHKRLRQAPGVGQVAATTLIALMPELGSRSPKAIAALAGLAPLNRDSGTLRGKRTIAGGRKRVRDALYMAALAAARSSPHYRAQYNALIARGKAKKLALIAIARKLLIALNAMIRDNAEFRPA
ncbi:MAG TPA: IS110 family transposase [Rhizomicrobium sp.]|jgi:transposase